MQEGGRQRNLQQRIPTENMAALKGKAPLRPPHDAMQEMLRLPAVTPEMLAGFEQAFTAKRSEKDQRNLIRKLLFNSGECSCPEPWTRRSCS